MMKLKYANLSEEEWRKKIQKIYLRGKKRNVTNISGSSTQATITSGLFHATMAPTHCQG